MLALPFFLFFLVPIALAAPSINISISSQLPPVGRVGQPYAFTIFRNTFTETPITYSVANLPTWLVFNPDLLNFQGVPTAADIGQVAVTVTATDTSGGTGQDTFIVMVTDQPAPAVHLGLSTQIANPKYHVFSSAVALPSNTGVYLHPYYSFSMGFQQSTFRPSNNASADHQQIYYSAHVRDTGTLPSWLIYANDTNTFSGVAPPTGSWTIVIVGSDYWGFDAVETSFLIEVDESYFDLQGGKDSLTNITTAAGGMVEYNLNLSTLTLNGEEVSTSELSVAVDLSKFSWLNYDSNTMSISGTTPSKYVNGSISSQYIPLSITSKSNSTDAVVMLWISISIQPSLFTTATIPNTTAAPGTSFSYSLEPYLRNTNQIASLNISSSASTGLSSWLTLNPTSYTLTGQVPNATALTKAEFRNLATTQDATLPLTVTAISMAGVTSTADLQIILSGVVSTTTASSASGTATGTAGAGNTAGGSTGSGSHSGLSTGGKIALGVVFGLLGLLLLILLLFCCCRRRRKREKKVVAEERPRHSTDGDSFVGIVRSPKSPKENNFFGKAFGQRGHVDPALTDPSRLQLGEIPRFSSIYINRPSNAGEQPRPELADIDAEANRPRQMGAIRGILNWGGGGLEQPKQELSQLSFPSLNPPSPVEGEIIRVADIGSPGQLSDFSQDFSSPSMNDRASWESRSTFQWSSHDGSRPRVLGADGRPISGAPSVPRPRQDFTPRYPRNASAGAIGRLVRPPSEAMSVGKDFSEFDHSHESSCSESHSGSASHSFLSGSGSGSSSPSFSPGSPARQQGAFTAGPSGLGKIMGNSGGFPETREMEEDDYGSDGSAVVTRVQRQALLDNAAARGQQVPRVMASKERFAHSPTQAERPDAQRTPSEEAMRGDADAFDDADEDNRRPESTAYAPSAITDLQGLGYPAEAIYFGSPEAKRRSAAEAAKSPTQAATRVPSIRPVPIEKDNILSPPLPQLGNILQELHRNRQPLKTTNTTLVNGRYIAQANESFNLHPQLNPRPAVSLSASTWSAPPPSTYRAEGLNGQLLPSWLHWDNKELELWGIPSLGDAGQIIEVKVIEKMQVEKRKSNDSSMLIPRTCNEREVGKCTIEVTDGMKSPDAFSLDGYASPPPQQT